MALKNCFVKVKEFAYVLQFWEAAGHRYMPRIFVEGLYLYIQEYNQSAVDMREFRHDTQIAERFRALNELISQSTEPKEAVLKAIKREFPGTYWAYFYENLEKNEAGQKQ